MVDIGRYEDIDHFVTDLFVVIATDLFCLLSLPLFLVVGGRDLGYPEQLFVIPGLGVIFNHT